MESPHNHTYTPSYLGGKLKREDIHRAISKYLSNVHFLIIKSIIFFYFLSLKCQVTYDITLNPKLPSCNPHGIMHFSHV